VVAHHEHLQQEQGKRSAFGEADAESAHVEMLVERVGAVWSSRVSRTRKNVLVAGDDDDVGSVSSSAGRMGR